MAVPAAGARLPQHHASPQQQHGAPGAHQAQGRPYIADPPPLDLYGPAQGGPHSMGPSSQHYAGPQQQHGAPGAHQAQSRPYIAPPPPADLDGPAPKAELVAAAKKVLATAWEEPIWAKGAQEIAERDPQLVLDVARESQALRLLGAGGLVSSSKRGQANSQAARSSFHPHNPP